MTPHRSAPRSLSKASELDFVILKSWKSDGRTDERTDGRAGGRSLVINQACKWNTLQIPNTYSSLHHLLRLDSYNSDPLCNPRPRIQITKGRRQRRLQQRHSDSTPWNHWNHPFSIQLTTEHWCCVHDQHVYYFYLLSFQAMLRVTLDCAEFVCRMV